MPLINFKLANKVALGSKQAKKVYVGSQLVWEKVKRLVAEGAFLSKDTRSAFTVVPVDELMIMEQGIYVHLIEGIYINEKWVDVKFYASYSGSIYQLSFYPGGNLKSKTGLDSLPKDSVIKLRYKPLELNSPYKKANMKCNKLNSKENNVTISKSDLDPLGIPTNSIKQIVHGEKLVDVTLTEESTYYATYTTTSGESFESITGYDYVLTNSHYIAVFYESR